MITKKCYLYFEITIRKKTFLIKSCYHRSLKNIALVEYVIYIYQYIVGYSCRTSSFWHLFSGKQTQTGSHPPRVVSRRAALRLAVAMTETVLFLETTYLYTSAGSLLFNLLVTVKNYWENSRYGFGIYHKNTTTWNVNITVWLFS